jgi:hypothetical protein
MQGALVVLVNNRRDWQRVVDEGWYRIPLKHAPSPLAAELLAFFFTKAFGKQAHQVCYYAPVLRYRTTTRHELLPNEADHPRANERYVRIDVGPVADLPRPIPSRSLRRVTFIGTTWERLCTADDVAALWQKDDAHAVLWEQFPDAIRKASQRLELEEQCAVYRVREQRALLKRNTHLNKRVR